MEGVRKYFIFIKKRVSSDWKDLAFCLGFERADIDNIDGRNRDDQSRCMDLLEEWLKRNGERATIEVLTKALSDAELQSTVDGLKNKYPELRCASSPVLPVHLQLGVAPQTTAQGQAAIGKEYKERILELERTLFTVEVLNDPVRYRKVRKLFLQHKALLKRAMKGSVILLLTFLRQTDVDRFYHNHYRVGEGTLSQQLSHILISDELRDKVKGAQLIVRLQVKHEDYVRVRDRLGQGLGRTTSVDNLLALPPPSRQVSRSSLSGLDLAVVSGEDQLCTDRTDDVSTLNFTAREVQSAVRTATVRTAREKSQQMEVQIQTLRVQLETARQDADAMRREVARMKQREETTHKVLSEHKEEIRTKELRIEAMREDIKTAREQTEANVFDSVTKEIARLKEKDEEAQKSLQEQWEEIKQLQETNKSLTAKMEELTAENTKMSNQLTDLREEVRKWREKDEESQKLLSEQKLEIGQSKIKVTRLEELQGAARYTVGSEAYPERSLSEGAQPMTKKQSLLTRSFQLLPAYLQGLPGEARGTHQEMECLTRGAESTSSLPDYPQLDYIADNAGRKWKNLARRLGFSESDIEVFEDKHRDLWERCMDMLITWQQRTGAEGTTGVLKEALENAGLKEIAHNFEFCLDAFVVYSNKDSAWVHELVQQLESPPHNLRICIDDRDFKVGISIIDNIHRAAADSRRILIVLSQNFLSSEWCKIKLKVAIETKGSDKNCVIPILRSECEIPDELAHLTYLDCTDGAVDIAMLASSIKSKVTHV